MRLCICIILRTKIMSRLLKIWIRKTEDFCRNTISWRQYLVNYLNSNKSAPYAFLKLLYVGSRSVELSSCEESFCAEWDHLALTLLKIVFNVWITKDSACWITMSGGRKNNSRVQSWMTYYESSIRCNGSTYDFFFFPYADSTHSKKKKTM